MHSIDLINKYKSLLVYYSKVHYDLLIKIFEVGFYYINNNHKNIDISIKNGAMFSVIRYFIEDNGIVVTDDKIIEIINNYIEYHKFNYENYINNLAINSGNNLTTMYSFCFKFLKQYNSIKAIE